MKKLNWFLTGTLLSFSFACGEKEMFKDVQQKKELETVQAETMTADSTKFTVIETPAPNKYKVLISWPKNSGDVKILVDNETVFQTSGMIDFFEDEVDGGSSKDYEVQKLVGGSVVNQIKNKINIPVDLVFSGKTVLTKNFEFIGKRLFLVNGPLIQTLSFNLAIDVEEIISENAIIETYPAGSKKTFEQNGESGGNISIRANKATGTLQTNLRGVHGGDGRGSACVIGFTMLCNASSGGSGGDAGFLSISIDDNKNFDVSKNLEVGVGGPGGSACVFQDFKQPLPPSIIWGYDQNCSGYGRGTANGATGASGTGQICLKLKKEAKNECF